METGYLVMAVPFDMGEQVITRINYYKNDAFSLARGLVESNKYSTVTVRKIGEQIYSYKRAKPDAEFVQEWEES